MPRPAQVCFFVIGLAASWLAMMCLHELGHIIHALLSGGRIARVILNPLAFSRTDISPNPHPGFVAWGGAIWGSVIPLLAWIALRRFDLAVLLRSLAGFCLTVNGGYFASAAVLPVGDTEDLIRAGQPRWLVTIAGILLLLAGLRLWNGVGSRLLRPPRYAAVISTAALAVLLGAMTLWTLLS